MSDLPWPGDGCVVISAAPHRGGAGLNFEDDALRLQNMQRRVRAAALPAAILVPFAGVLGVAVHAAHMARSVVDSGVLLALLAGLAAVGQVEPGLRGVVDALPHHGALVEVLDVAVQLGRAAEFLVANAAGNAVGVAPERPGRAGDLALRDFLLVGGEWYALGDVVRDDWLFGQQKVLSPGTAHVHAFGRRGGAVGFVGCWGGGAFGVTHRDIAIFVTVGGNHGYRVWGRRKGGRSIVMKGNIRTDGQPTRTDALAGNSRLEGSRRKSGSCK